MPESWGPARYGSPCRECAYFWPTEIPVARAIVAAMPARYASLLVGTDGRQRHPLLGWTAAGYVVHVADNLRSWAEVVAGAALGGPAATPEYDADALALARSYSAVSVQAALWSVRRAVCDWQDAIDLGLAAGVHLRHPERGQLSVADVVSATSHDAFHHAWDISRF